MAILNEEQVAEPRADYPSQKKKTTASQREAARIRQARRRERLKKAQTAAEGETFSQYWLIQRNKLTEEQRAEYERRENDVLDLQYVMRLYLEDRYNAEGDVLNLQPEERVSLQELIEEVREEISTNGWCETMILLVSRLCTPHEKEFYDAVIAKGGATAILVRYGYRTGIDSGLYEMFRERFLEETPLHRGDR